VPLYRWLERQADRIVCNSEATGRAVIAEGYPGGRISVVPNGIDVDRFRPPTVRQLQDVPRLICVAALRPEKGVDRLVQLLAPLLRSKRATLTLVGDGSERTAVEAVISTLQLGNSVRLLGPQTDIVPILHDADIYVSAARIEGFGIAVAEAAATALPAVCVAAPGGLNEVVVDGVTGYLVPEHRGDLFQESVRRLCDDAALRLKLGSAAQAHVRRRFSLAEVGRQLESVLLAR
jgi:glycosyltransferase involved in cell wall biosynthesis